MGIFVTYADNSFLSREWHPEQRLLNPFFLFFAPHGPMVSLKFEPNNGSFLRFWVFYYRNKKEVVKDICRFSTDGFKLYRSHHVHVRQKIKKWV